ncbi:MAG: choice-of-anchor Q domain-containing protein [Chloroflexota bacterium]
MFGHTVASDGGRIVLPANGTYSVNVFDYFGPLTGTYSFRVLPVTDSTFPVTIGDLISNGNPSVGAGNIESPGVKDIYTFTATAGQVVLFDALTTSNASIRWQLLNPTATGIFDTGTNSDGGLRTLATAGTYSIVVYSNSDATGTYSFRFSLSTSTEFAIGLGTTVSNNSPATGAGNITPAGNIDVYIFGGTAGQHINLDVLSGAAVNMHWRLVSPSDTEIFNTSFADQNNVALPETGTYTLRVQASASNPSFTGTYSFQLLETPLIQNFNISIGDSISNGLPSAGAGNIETQGGEDIYSFTASAGQIIYLDAISSSNGNVAWQLLNPSNAVIFDLFITSSGGRRVLPTAGTYKIRVYGYNNSSGTYSFKLWGVTDNNFAINVGDTISSGVPGTGAGNIEQIGTEDNYTFSVAAGQIVYFEALSSSNSDVAWRLRDPSSTQIFDLYLTQDGGRRVLSTPGTYTVNAYGYQGSTGTYSFRLFNVVDHNFAINLGDTISNGVPGAGAGNIETLGAEDNYTFSVSAGQTILFEGLNASDSSLAWRLRDPSSNQIFDLYVNSTSTQRTLNSAGTYTLNLYGYQASTGTYSFTLVDLTESAQPGPTFTVNSTAATDDGVCGILNCTLIEAINAANDDGVASTIELESSQTYTLLAVNNTDVEDGANGLPVISSAITIHGHNSTIFNNSGTPFRLFYVNEDGDLSLSNLTLQAGDAGTNNGGALFNGNSSTLNNVIVQDSQAGLGGGVYNADDAELTIVNSSLRDNRAVGGDGGALYNEANGSVSIDGSSFFNNNASSGAGIFNAGFSLTINDTTIEGNIGTGNGGGIYYVIGDSMTITNSTIANNTGVSGGGMYTQGNTTIVNSTIANNAAEFGGGIYDDGGVTINFVTITGNISGGVYTSAVLNAKNSIISGQASGSDCSGDVNDSGVNFSETSGCTGFLEGTPTQLKLGTLANNGGATETIELGIGSIAIDAASDCTILGGTTVTTDQRGAPRPQGAACDAGAFEAPTSVQTFAINFGDTVSDGMPAAGAGNIETNGAVDEYTFTLAPGQTAAVTPLSGGLDIQGEWFDSFNNSQSVFSFQSSYNTLTSVDGGSFKLRIHADPSNPTFNGTYSFEFAEVPDNAQAGPTFTVNSVTDNDDGMCGTNNCTLIEAITAANAQAGANTINLGSNQTYILSDVNNTDNDANGLPVISTEITINSNNSTIQRSNDDFTPEFRIFDVATTGNLTLNDALLGNGSTTEANGGIIDNRGVLLINNVILEDGFAYSGGAIYNDSSASATLHNSTMRDNRAISGAALVNAGTGTANIDGSSFFNNSAGLGGAIINDGTMTVNTSTFTGNMSTTDQGGAIANFATLTVNQSTFTNNTATTNGGAIDSSAFGAATTTLTITNSTLNNNTAASLGGAILNYADVASSMANLTVRNSTITGNSSPYGGGVANFGGTGTETATVEFSTIVGNQASSLAANLYNGASKTFNAKNLIVAQPAGSTNCDGVFTTDGPNFVDDASCNSFLQRTAPQLNLGTLANNGGPTQTIALGTGSVAIDSTDCNTFGSGGTALPTDQRGVTRPQGSACDAGAYEAALSDTAQPGPTFTVNTTAMNDDGMCGTANCTLIEAITASNMQSGANTIILGSGETYTLSVVNNNIDGPNALPDVTSAITINGNGATITRDSTGETPHFRLFHVSSSVTLDLANMYITNGYVDGANRGGAIFNKGTLTLNNVDVSGNTADSGGGLNIANGGYAGINASHIHNNTSSTLGGGFYVEAGGSATVDGTLIAHNNSAAYGGGLYADGGLSLNHVTITDNTAGGGAGMRVCCSGTINITNSNISNNTAASYGGGIMNLSLLLNIDSTTISGNVVTAPAGASFNGEGGGILNRQSGNVNLSNSTVSLNNAAVGAGIASDNSMTLINTSTIANNIGGGIFGDAGSSTGIALSTIVNNTVNPGIDSTGAVTISDSIVANNTAGDCNATLTAQGVNFATDATCNGFTQKTSGELNLQALANNGGSTQTIALGTGSAAIDTVTDCLGATVDQRGVERPQGPACDAGAYEAEISDTAQPGPTFTVNTTAMNDDGMCGTNNCTLIEAINAANAQAGANTIELNNGGADYVMDAVNNTTDGDNGLPNITSDITINAHLGNIRRNPSAIQFRLFHVASSGSLTINNAELIFGDADIYDGGVIYSDGTVTLNHVDVSYSRGSSGGAIRNGNGTLTINDSNFAINTASGAGGAIFNNTGTLTVNRTSFDSNTSAQNGGAIYNTNGGHTTLTRTAFSRNTALSGGALFNVIGSSVLKIINSTISGNYTNGSNSAALYNAATLRLSFVTIAYNNGGGLYNSGGVNWGLKNTIIAAQSSGANCAGTQLSVSEGANFANDATCSTLGITVTSGPLIDPIFSYNGLGLSVVHTLPSGSPAIDAVTDCTDSDDNAVTLDQRGLTRPQGANCDSGAFEVMGGAGTPTPTVTPPPGDTPQSGTNLVVNNSTDIDDGVCGVTNCSLREAINRANALPGANDITFNTGDSYPTIVLGGTELSVTTAITITPPVRAFINGNSLSRVFNIDVGGNLTLTNVDVFGGKAAQGAGILNANQLTLSGSQLYSNEATSSGSGLYNTGIVTVSGSNFYSNVAEFEGGAVTNNGVMTITNSYFYNNITTTNEPGATGGAIANNGDLTVTGTAFIANYVQNGGSIGGAIASSGNLTVDISLFQYNAAALGGAVYTNGEGIATFTNVTFSANSATTNGGGLYIAAPTNLSFVTIADNTGGGIYSDLVTYGVKNSVLARQASGANCAGTPPSGSGANFTDDASCGLVGFTNTATALIEGLAYNIGRVNTYALTQNSPARDAATDCTAIGGATVTTDSRDIARPQGATCDAGAYEFGGDLHVTTNKIIEDASDGLCSLPEAIKAANTGTTASGVNGECVPSGTSPEVITLGANQTYKLTQVNNTTQGPNGLPAITNPNVYLYMNNSTITRASDAPDFRIFYIAPGGSLYFTNTGTISGGHLSGTDKGAGILNQGSLTAGGLVFENHAAAGNGGAIYNDAGANTNLFGNILRGNQAEQGGAFYNVGTLTFNGGGYSNRFENNHATRGGALYNVGSANDLTASFINNQATDAGGAVYLDGGPLNLSNSTLSGNQAARGAAVFQNSGSGVITFSTIADNTTTGGSSGAVVANDGTTTLSNSILANNPGGNCAGLPTNGDHNLQFPGTSCGVGFAAANPLLSTRQEYGVSSYYPLLIGSPAIDAADNAVCPGYDNVSRARPVGAGCDIGSFEGNGEALTGSLTVTTTSMAINPSDGLCSLPEAINAANSDTAAEGAAQGECVPNGNAGALDSITLGSGLTYTLTTVDNNTNGANGLPVITSPIVINGNGSTITRNSEAQFRLFYNASIGNLTLNKVTLTNGFGDPGGAILSNGNLILNYVSVANNSSSSGGGIFINGTAAINNSAISGNQGLSPDGGGIFVNGDASLTLSNSTVAGNSAANTGGGIVTGLGSTVVVNIYNSTIANNVAAQGAGIMVWGGTVRVYNTIIANNFEQDGVTVGNCVGNVQAGSGFGSNLQWPDVTCTDEILTDDPLLGPLTGSPGYLPLGAGSPAIDAGDNTICAASPVNSIDQRGVARPANACDIGAVEATEVPALVAGTTGGAAALVNAAGTQDFVRFGDTTIGPIEGDQWRGDNVAIPSSPTFNIGRDPLGSDTNHVTDWLSQGSSAGGQNFAKAVINEVFTGTNDLVELYNPIIDTVDLSGWELTLYDSNDQVITLPNSGATTYTYRFPNGTLLRPGQFLVVAETNPGDGIYSILLGKDTINWDDWNATGAVALSNGVTGMDFVRFGGSGISPLTVDAPAGTVFTGIVPAPLPGESIGRNADSADTDTADDWYSQSPSVGQINPTLNPPDNDLFNNAIVINPLPFRDTGNTLSATAANDPLTSCGFSVGHTVWYKYTAANSNPVRFQTDGSDFNTVLAVFTLNSSTNTLQQVSGLCSRMDDEPGSRLTLNPTANTIYYVMIGGHLNTSGSYVFSANAPTNDDIDDTINIGTIADLPFRTFSLNAGGVPISNTNVTAASQLISDPLTSCATTVGRSVWYTYTAADATRLRLQTTGTSFDTVIAIYTGSLGENGKVDRTSLQEVACNNDDTSTTTSDMGFTPVPGTTYYIEVAGNSDAGGSLLFEVDVFPSPNNDLVENAYVVTPDTDPLRLGAFKVTTPDGTVNAPFAEDTTGATATDDATASCGLNLGGSVWFVYTDDIASDTPATVVFQTFASDYDTAMTIYTGTPDNLTEAACSDDVGVNQGSRLTLGVTDDGADVALVEGQTYYIRISGYFGETGNLTFNAFVPQVAAPTNDDPNTPYTIIFNSDNGSYTIDGVTDPLNIKPFVQDTTGTNPALEDAASKITCGQDVGHTVWYRYVAPENQRVVFDADGSDFDTVIAAFIEQTDGNLNSLVEVGCNDDFGSRPQSKLTLNTANGVILYVMFGGYKQDRGNLSLGVQQIVPVVTDFTLVNAGLIGDIRMLSNTDPNTLDLSALPAFTIRANTQPSEVGSVKFELHDFDSGALILNYMDDMPPYSLTGNDPDGGYIAWSSVTPGKYKLTATPYTAADGQGKIGTPQTITLIVNGSNAAPVIAADNTSIAVNEGLTALNSGTFSDADVGDTVSLSASVGTVTADLSDPEHPVWNWLFETSDGPADSQTVTITADDGHGHQTPTTFALVVNNVAPTATFTPVFISQNVRRLTFGAPVDVNADIPGIVYSYDCTFDNDGDSSNDDFDVTGVTTNSYDCTFPGPGNYTVRGRIADKDGGFSDYTADITISASNIAPTVNVGGDQNIQLPTNTVALLGVVSDDGLPTGSTLTYAWTVINNPPAPVVFSAPDALSTNATFTIAGTYTLQLSASDGQLTGSDTLTVVVAPADNVPPDAKAGTDQLVTDTAPYGSQDVTLDGSASTDSDGSIVGYAWTEGATLLASIVNPTIPLADGIHTITLTVTDDKGAIDTDDVIVEVRLPDNQAPSVNAGDDQNTQLPSASVSLAGTASDDGLPLPASLTYTWTAINTPPGPVVFSAANALSTNATFTVAGTYTLQLSVSDGQLSSSDTVTVSVNAASVIPPHADAGPDQTVADVAPFGTESVTLDGSASTDDGNIVSYVWTENAQVIANGVKPSIPLADGTHYITLTVTDDSGATATDDVIVMVQLPANQAPTVNAGSDQSIQLPVNSVALVGSVSDDGLPLPPTLTYTWTGPTGVNFSTPNALSTTATFSTAGTYILTLTASDGQLSGSDTVQIVVSSQSTGSNEVTDQVAKSSDDVNEDGSTYDATNPLLWFGTGQSTSKSYLGLRFTNLEIPKGATITEAHIEVYTASAQWINMRILIGADAVDNSATFTSATRPSTRTFSTARVDYRSNTPWMGGTWNDIGDVKAVIQEIVNRTGWQSGNSLAILIKGLGAQWGRKFVTSYDGDPAHAPRLVISYAGGPPPPNQPPVITLDNPSAVATALEGQPTNIITGTFGDPDNNPVTLTPSLGTLQIVGNTWSWSYTPPDGPVNTNVTITAKDSKGASALVPVTFGLTVTNVSPTAVFAAQPASTFPNNAVALTFSTPVDVAADLGSLTYSVDCGNGGVIQTTAPFSCTYASTGTFTALGTVADKDGGSNTYQAVITVNDVSTAPTTITPQVSASSDDVNQSGNTFQANLATIWVGTEGNAAQSYTGLRFNNLSIPVGATITEAHLEFYTTANTWINVDVLIAADATDNSVTFSNATRPSTRTFTTTRVTHHSNVQWLANSWNILTGNLAGVVQEVVSRAGWQSGNSLSIILKGIGSQWARKFVTSYEGNPAFAPRLVISYTPPAAPVAANDDPPVPLNLTLANPPSAAFAMGLSSGDAPLNIQFTDTSTGDIAGYAWDFGDGAASTDQNPAHIYTAAGSYTVILTVTGTDATTSAAQAVINVTAPVVVPTDTPPPPTDTPTEIPTEIATTPPPSDTPTDVPTEVATTPPPLAEQTAAP